MNEGKFMKNKTIKNLFYLPLLTLLGACATHEIKPANPKILEQIQAIDHTQNATMVIYRPEETVGYALRPTVVLDGKDLVNIGNGEAFVSFISPGKYVFEMDDKKSGTEVNLKPGDEIFLKVDIITGTWKGSGKLTQVMPQQGNYEATRLEIISPKEIEIPIYRPANSEAIIRELEKQRRPQFRK